MKITYECKRLVSNLILVSIVVSVCIAVAYLILSIRGYLLCHGLPLEYSPSFSPLHACVVNEGGITTTYTIDYTRYTTRFAEDIK